MAIKHICECGCNGVIEAKPHHKKYGIPSFLRGHNSRVRNPFSGLTHTDVIKAAQSERMKDRLRPPCSSETKSRISAAKIGNKHSTQTRNKIGLAGKGRVATKATRRKMSLSHLGSKSSFWKGGVDQKAYKHYRNLDYKLWRESVYLRDDYTCQDCGKKGVFLHPHHIKSYTHYPSLRYVVKNGVSMCKECHMSFHGLTKKGVQ